METKIVFTIMSLMLVAFVPAVSAQVEASSNSGVMTEKIYLTLLPN